jgi:ribosome modulation factor
MIHDSKKIDRVRDSYLSPSPRQIGYRDGCRAPMRSQRRCPYPLDTWPYREWLAGLVEAVNDYNQGLT